MIRALLFAGLAIFAAPARAQTCNKPVDAFTPVVALAQATAGLPAAEQAAQFEAKIIQRFPALYDPRVTGIAHGATRDARIVASLDQIRSGSVSDEAKASVIELLPRITAIYAGDFADFRCDFPIYLMDSLGQLDGAGRFVGGRPSLVIGIETLAGENPAGRQVFLTHELFHRYHFQAAGFSDDDGDSQALWRVLWAEGLATYVSMKLTPGATVGDALLLPPDIEAEAKPKLAEIAGRLLKQLDRPNLATFNLLFTYGGPQARAAGLPDRSGYYVGYLVAADLGRGRTVNQLAHLRGPALYKSIRASLMKIGARDYRPA
jgi:hypothetical protein